MKIIFLKPTGTCTIFMTNKNVYMGRDRQTTKYYNLHPKILDFKME